VLPPTDIHFYDFDIIFNNDIIAPKTILNYFFNLQTIFWVSPSKSCGAQTRKVGYK